MAKIVTSDGCWMWQGQIAANGYGRFRPDPQRPSMQAHRVAYELFVGPIPDGLQLDHLCGVRACVRPDHLEPVTGRENRLRSLANVITINAAKTECKRGHPFTPENTYVRPDRGHRSCKTCQRENERRYREKV